MKTLFTLAIGAALALTASQNVTAQPNLNRHYNSGQNEGIDYAPSDRYILSGNFNPSTINGWNNISPITGFPNGRIQLQEIDNALNTVWFKTYVTLAEQTAIRTRKCNYLDVFFKCGYAKHTSDGGYIVCGSVRKDGETSGCPGATYDHVFLLKVDAGGNAMWYKRYDKYGMLNSVTETAAGNFMACGVDGASGLGTSLIICTDAGGNLLWSKNTLTRSYWDPGVTVPSEYFQVIQYNGVNALVGVASTLGNTWGGLLLTLIDDAGNYIQNQIVDNEDFQYTLVGKGLADAGDGDLVITGHSNQPCLTTITLMIMKIDPYTMTVKFLKFYSDDYSWGNGVTVFRGNKIAATGVNYTNNGAVYVETDFMGNLARYVIYPTADALVGKSMTHNLAADIPVFSGQYTIGGPSTFVVENSWNRDCAPDMGVPEHYPPYLTYPTPDQDAGVHQINDDAVAYDMPQSEWNVCEPVIVAPKPASLSANQLAVLKKEGMLIAPNPATDEIDIHVNPEDVAGATIKIYDITGRLVVSKKVSKEEDLFRIDVSGFAPGVYVVNFMNESGGTWHSNLLKR